MSVAVPYDKNNMGKKSDKPLTFRQAIWLALHTPHLTHKQIVELRKKDKQIKKKKTKK